MRRRPAPELQFLAEKAIGASPCKDCPERRPGCGCERFQSWKRRLQDVKAEIRRKNKDGRFRPW